MTTRSPLGQCALFLVCSSAHSVKHALPIVRCVLQLIHSLWDTCGCRQHVDLMASTDTAHQEFRRRSRGRRLECLAEMRYESFRTWFPKELEVEMNRGDNVEDDVKALMYPPSRNAKSYRLMYAYGNHI